MPMSIQVDAMSVFAAITATFIKHPAEKSLLSHVQFIREMLDNQVLAVILWVDTRDMLSDGLTKGAVDRQSLHDLMDGFQKFQHECKAWSSKIVTSRKGLSPEVIASAAGTSTNMESAD